MTHKYIMLPEQQKGSLGSFHFKLGIKKIYITQDLENLSAKEIACL